MRLSIQFPVDIGPRPVSPGIVSQRSKHRNGLEIYGRQDFAAALGTDRNRSTRNSSDITAISVSSSVTKLHAVVTYFLTRSYSDVFSSRLIIRCVIRGPSVTFCTKWLICVNNQVFLSFLE